MNFSILQFDVAKDSKKAIENAEKALISAEESQHLCEEEMLIDSKVLLDLLSDNLILWKGEEDNEFSDSGGEEL
jgi:hypothetical protein